jgi:glycosyltransferase involved in cell wall biosynthesis
VLGGDRGGVPELVGPAATLPAEEVGAWTAALRALWDDPAARARAGEEALARARAEHAPEVFYRRLSAIYAQALAR